MGDGKQKGLIRNFTDVEAPYTFFIPSYQRGYRWSERQVLDLLDDLKEFQDKQASDNEVNSDIQDGNKKLYCLQPLIVKKKTDNGREEWEVIDGQQRLTTIYLILTYLKNKGNLTNQKWKSFDLKYDRSDIFSDTQITEWLEKEGEANKDINKYFAFRAYKTIKDWFEGTGDIRWEQNDSRKKSGFNENFIKIIREQTFFILYDIESKPEDNGLNDNNKSKENNDQLTDENAIDTFTKENAGKIPMTSSELIRALLFGNRNSEELSIMSLEWENIEKRLADDSFWYFISNKSDVATRIDIVFYCVARKMYNKKDNFLFNKYFSFYVISNHIKNSSSKNVREEIWEKVIRCFAILEDCYENFVLYHKIGYLITAEKTFHIDTYDKLYQIYKLIDEGKDDVNSSLDKYIKGSINIKNKDEIEKLSYTKDKDKIFKILLLYNVMTIIGKVEDESENNIVSAYDDCYRFPFNKFKRRRKNIKINTIGKENNNLYDEPERWDLEHIHSVESELPNNIKEIVEMFNSIIIDLKEISSMHRELNDLEKYIREIEKDDVVNDSKIDTIKGDLRKLLQLLKEKDEYKQYLETDNFLNNLALLDYSTNRSYQNRPFSFKRQRIIKREEDGQFIPLCTKNVFLKWFLYKNSNNYLPETLTIWSEKDKDVYIEEINKKIEYYYDPKKQKS